MTTTLAFILVIGFLVLVHELGHFLVAKWTGVRVNAFSIGFGPKLASFRRGDTEYRISAIPLGGYVKMAGENPAEPRTGAPDEFFSKSVPERLGIVLAGPGMNFLWAFIFFAVMFVYGVKQPAFLQQPARIGWVEAGTPAATAGVHPGDIITRMDDRTISTWEQALAFVDTLSAQRLHIAVRRSGQVLVFEIDSAKQQIDNRQGIWGIYPPTPAVVGEVRKGWPAEEAGLQPGDRIVALNGEHISDWAQLTTVIHSSPGKEIELVVQRGSRELPLRLVPRLDHADGKGYIGITVRQDVVVEKYGLLASLRESATLNGRMAGLTLSYLWRVITGKESSKALGGPIMIAKVAGEAARIGLSALLRLMGFLSLQLALLNLLPIPVLDGGHVVFLAIEAITRKPVNLRVREIVQMIGLLLLLSIMALAFYNDISRIFSP